MGRALHEEPDVVWVAKGLHVPGQQCSGLRGQGASLLQCAHEGDVGRVYDVGRGVATEVVAWHVEVVNLWAVRERCNNCKKPPTLYLTWPFLPNQMSTFLRCFW